MSDSHDSRELEIRSETAARHLKHCRDVSAPEVKKQAMLAAILVRVGPVGPGNGGDPPATGDGLGATPAAGAKLGSILGSKVAIVAGACAIIGGMGVGAHWASRASRPSPTTSAVTIPTQSPLPEVEGTLQDPAGDPAPIAPMIPSPPRIAPPIRRAVSTAQSLEPPPAVSAVPEGPSPLEQESLGVASAHAKLRNGDAAGALTLLSAMRQQFPRPLEGDFGSEWSPPRW